MRTKTKVWLIVAGALVLVGCMLFTGVMTMLEWDFTKLSTVRYESTTYEIDEAFDRISIHVDTADILFARSADGECRIESYDEEDVRYAVFVEDGTLTIALVEEDKPVIRLIGLNFGAPKMTIYLPEMEYASLYIRESTGDVEITEDFLFGHVDISLSTGDVNVRAASHGLIKIHTSTGDICVENIAAGSLDLLVSSGKVTVSHVTCQGDVAIDVSTGKVNLTNLACKNLFSNGDTGDIVLHQVMATETISVERSTGDVKFDSSDAAQIYVITDTGDVTGSLLTSKVFIAQADTGYVDVPKTVDGGRCEIYTDTGVIRITIKQ